MSSNGHFTGTFYLGSYLERKQQPGREGAALGGPVSGSWETALPFGGWLCKVNGKEQEATVGGVGEGPCGFTPQTDLSRTGQPLEGRDPQTPEALSCALWLVSEATSLATPSPVGGIYP